LTKRQKLLLIPYLFSLSILALFSCSTSQTNSILPLDSLPGGLDGPTVQNIGARSATIEFTATIPIVCNVAYGTDSDYGQLTLMAMTSAVTDHEIDIIGLEPNTTYHYRITITDLESNVYQSGDLTFQTAVDTGQEEPAGVNVAGIAEGATTIGISSNWGGGGLDSSFGGNKAIDGLTSTAWSSNGDGDDAWIEIELDHTFDIHAIGFWTRTMGMSAQISSFQVTVDGTEYGPFSVPDASTIYYYDLDVQAGRLKFEVVDSSGGNTGAIEIRAYTLNN